MCTSTTVQVSPNILIKVVKRQRLLCVPRDSASAVERVPDRNDVRGGKILYYGQTYLVSQVQKHVFSGTEDTAVSSQVLSAGMACTRYISGI